MIYTMEDLMKKAHYEASRLYEWFEIDGNTIAPRCKRDTGLLKALNVLNALFD